MLNRFIMLPLLFAALPAFASEQASATELRVVFSSGLQTIYKDACAHACKGQAACLDECTSFALEVAEQGIADGDTEYAVCKEQGGMLAERMPACSDAFANLFDVTKENTIGEFLAFLLQVSERCSGASLCDAQVQGHPGDEA